MPYLGQGEVPVLAGLRHPWQRTISRPFTAFLSNRTDRFLQAVNLHFGLYIRFWKQAFHCIWCNQDFNYLHFEGIELMIKTVGNPTLCHKWYSQVNAGYIRIMTLWWSEFLQNMRNVHFGIDFLLVFHRKDLCEAKHKTASVFKKADGPPSRDIW